MDETLFEVYQALILFIPMALLVARFYRPKVVSWWVVVIATASLSWVLDSEVERLRVGKPFDEVAQCRAANVNVIPPPECDTPIVDYFAAHPNLRWMPGMLCLVFLLPFYGMAQYARRALAADPAE